MQKYSPILCESEQEVRERAQGLGNPLHSHHIHPRTALSMTAKHSVPLLAGLICWPGLDAGHPGGQNPGLKSHTQGALFITLTGNTLRREGKGA